MKNCPLSRHTSPVSYIRVLLMYLLPKSEDTTESSAHSKINPTNFCQCSRNKILEKRPISFIIHKIPLETTKTMAYCFFAPILHNYKCQRYSIIPTYSRYDRPRSAGARYMLSIVHASLDCSEVDVHRGCKISITRALAYHTEQRSVVIYPYDCC